MLLGNGKVTACVLVHIPEDTHPASAQYNPSATVPSLPGLYPLIPLTNKILFPTAAYS